MDADHIAAARTRLTGRARWTKLPRHRCCSIAAAAAAAAVALTLASTIVAVAGTLDAPDRAACMASVVPEPPPARLDIMARGFNLTGWLDSMPARPPDRDMLAQLRQRGFTHIRLPVTAERIMAAFSAPDAVKRQLDELDGALTVLADLGYGVSLDLHPGERLGRMQTNDPALAFDLIDATWRSLARRYANRSPDRLYFELLNEPKGPPSPWATQAARLVATIRREAPNHTLIYGPANFQRIDALQELRPLADRNIVYAVHFYDPMIFTHQGLDWSDDPLRYLAGIPFPARASDPDVTRLVDSLSLQGRGAAVALVKRQLTAPWTEERVASEIASAGAWAERFQRPVIINEFGVLGWKTAPADRARWLRTVRMAAERHCIGWTHWDYADSFGFMRRIGEREVPDEAIMDALLGSRRSQR
jgi:endoglucanase